MTEQQNTSAERRPLLEIAAEIGQEFGISPELAVTGGIWGRRWLQELEDVGYLNTSDTVALTTARDIALEQTPEIIRDENGKPSYRSEYAALQTLYALSGERAEQYRSALEGDRLRVIPHFDRLDEVAGTLLHARDNLIYPFNTDLTELPQDEPNLPKNLERGGVDEAMFWFISCYFMRGQIESIAAVRGLSKLYDAHPEIFDPFVAQHQTPEYIEGLLREYGLGSGSIGNSKGWVKNAPRLIKQCDGDPRKLFEGTTDYQELKKRIMNQGKGKGFIGFQEKMTSMLTYWFMSSELIPYHHHPLPVDLHVVRISSSTEIVTYENIPDGNNILSNQTLEILRTMFEDYSHTYNVSQLALCDVIWAHGKALCGDAVGNRTYEPNRLNGRDGRKTLLVREPITFDAVQMKRHERTCAACPLNESCSHSLPSKPYYLHGELVIHPRPEPPQDAIFSARETHAANPMRLPSRLSTAQPDITTPNLEGLF